MPAGVHPHELSAGQRLHELARVLRAAGGRGRAGRLRDMRLLGVGRCLGLAEARALPSRAWPEVLLRSTGMSLWRPASLPRQAPQPQVGKPPNPAHRQPAPSPCAWAHLRISSSRPHTTRVGSFTSEMRSLTAYLQQRRVEGAPLLSAMLQTAAAARQPARSPELRLRALPSQGKRPGRGHP